jgi:hypothetical protein
VLVIDDQAFAATIRSWQGWPKGLLVEWRFTNNDGLVVQTALEAVSIPYKSQVEMSLILAASGHIANEFPLFPLLAGRV